MSAGLKSLFAFWIGGAGYVVPIPFRLIFEGAAVFDKTANASGVFDKIIDASGVFDKIINDSGVFDKTSNDSGVFDKTVSVAVTVRM